MTTPLRIFPNVEDCKIRNRVNCPFEDCSDTFTSESNLNLHLFKTHKKKKLQKSEVETWYFCPEIDCVWNGIKHFKNMKSLRQHYLKMHTEKLYNCVSCRKSFSSEKILLRHQKFCNISFACLNCKASYGCYETLKTHCRRKKHSLLTKDEYKAKQILSQNKCEIVQSVGGRLLLSNKSLASVQVNLKPPIASQQTQTGLESHGLSVETQTTYFAPISKQTDNNFRTINTQTDSVESKESSCNTTFELDNYDFALIEKNSSSTQTCHSSEDIFSTATSTHSHINTDTSDLLSDSLSNFDAANFFNCNTETQTDFIFDNELFNADFYSNMYTQTCDEILSGLNGFTDIQTQTVQECLRSVESQTLMSSTDKLCPNIFKDIVHSETQTDAEFRHMLEIINS